MSDNMLRAPARAAARGLRVRRVCLMLAVMLTASAGTAAAVTVSPMALYLGSGARSTTITLHNPNPLPEEIEISFGFGYPQTDDAGAIQVQLVETAPDGEPTAAPWLRAFPRRLVLQPGQRQVVRILASPPAGLAEGEYWARVMVKARGGQPPIEQTNGNVSVAIMMQTVIAPSLSYRQGSVRTGVEVGGARAVAAEGGVELRLDLRRSGNAAYLGNVLAEVVDPSGEVIGSADLDLAVYRQLEPRILIPTSRRPAPGAAVRYIVDADRPDLPPAAVLPAEPVRAVAPVVSG